MKNKITIIGSGLTGPAMGMLLANNNFDVDIFERRSDMRSSNTYSGRSINLALSQRGITTLKEINIFDDIKNNIIPMSGRLIHDIDGDTNFQPYGSNKNEVIYSVSRSDLNKKLINKAEKIRNINFYFDQELTDIDIKNKILIFNKENKINFNHIIGCDGSSSVLRQKIIKKNSTTYKKIPLGHGYKELTIHPSGSNNYKIDSNVLHIWPRNDFMLIALPNMNKTFTCTLFMSMNGSLSFESINDRNDIKTFFKTYFPDITKLIPDFIDQYLNNPIGKLATIYMNPWHYDNIALLIGDAAHAIVPFFGQGMNAAFQDCYVLNRLIVKYKNDWRKIFAAFSEIHVKNGHAIANMAIENYEEMRNSVNKEKYKLERNIELRLEKELDDLFIPRYSMVAFNDLPYSEVYNKGILQKKIIQKIIKKDPSGKKIDFQMVRNYLLK